MTHNKLHEMILVKNEIMRIVKREQLDYSTKRSIMKRLKVIEDIIGTGNQPTVEDILDSSQNI